ncbi:hypothetical protein [Halocola ammonii]
MKYWSTRVALLAPMIFAIVEIMSIFREELFGIVPGYAPHNFSFNFGFYLPAHFFLSTLCLLVIIRTYINWDIWPAKIEKYVALLLSVPFFLNGVYMSSKIFF